ncbi:hypothetical protein B296_00014881 [Ensete ventricosum]|uniref:F-box domain-containing protein n=1 Tax=Ensete ventricosum TaxID=4639 RepID=A0A426Z9M0_ENSVE|nr:hypothetical protein B296_00014881 [Ensete ventricosum]
MVSTESLTGRIHIGSESNNRVPYGFPDRHHSTTCFRPKQAVVVTTAIVITIVTKAIPKKWPSVIHATPTLPRVQALTCFKCTHVSMSTAMHADGTCGVVSLGDLGRRITSGRAVRFLEPERRNGSLDRLVDGHGRPCGQMKGTWSGSAIGFLLPQLQRCFGSPVPGHSYGCFGSTVEGSSGGYWRRPEKRRRTDSPFNESRTDQGRGQDLISNLPNECLLLIFSFLPIPGDRCRCSAVSRRWFALQAFLRRSEFRTNVVLPPRSRHEISRCVQGSSANDLRLGAMAIGMDACGILTELSVINTLPCSPLPHHHHHHHHRHVSDVGLSAIAQACSNLRSLALHYCTKVTDRGIATVAQNCRALKNLELTHAVSVTNHGLVILATRCLKLASLSLTACPRVTDRSLEAFSKHSTHLKSITVARCPFITDYGILSIVVMLTKLETVKLSSMKLGDGVLRAIARSGEQIKTLALEQVWGVSVTGYRCIGETTRLKGLSLDACTGLTDRCFRRLSPTSFAGLKKVAMTSCSSLTDWSLLALTELAVGLESLHLDTFGAFTYRGLMIALRNCSRTLKALTLVKCDFRGRGALEQQEVYAPRLLPLPAQCSMLQTVKLEECEGLGDGFILWIGQACKSIADVSFVRMDSITDYGIKSFMNQLKGWNRISRVDLSGSAGVGNRSVWAVTRECKARLRSLLLRGCERVSDRGAAVITRRCTKLVELDLGGCSISDEAVEKVVGEDPPDLEVLSLAGCTRITDRSLDALDEYGGLGLNRLDLTGCPGLSQFRVNFIKIYIDVVDY